MSSGSPSIRVLYFAAARTTIGLSSETLSLPSTPFPLSSLVSLIANKYSEQGAEAVLRTCRWSVDNTLIEIDEIQEWTLQEMSTSSTSKGIEVDATKTEKAKKPLLSSPALSKFSAHHFSPSPNGVDSNLLILLHGLGDSDTGFFSLGQNLQRTLPQTAVLTLQAPLAVPFLDGPHWMWYPSFDQFGELLTKPNPTQTVKDLIAILEHLVSQCGWLSSSIHIFGFGQGATVALETLVRWSSTHPQPLGSIVSVSGTLLSHPTHQPSSSSSTPVLQIYRSHNEPSNTRWASHRKSTSSLTLHRLPLATGGVEEAMLKGQQWDCVMEFWSKFLRNRSSWELQGSVVQL